MLRNVALAQHLEHKLPQRDLTRIRRVLRNTRLSPELLEAVTKMPPVALTAETKETLDKIAATKPKANLADALIQFSDSVTRLQADRRQDMMRRSSERLLSSFGAPVATAPADHTDEIVTALHALLEVQREQHEAQGRMAMEYRRSEHRWKVTTAVLGVLAIIGGPTLWSWLSAALASL